MMDRLPLRLHTSVAFQFVSFHELWRLSMGRGKNGPIGSVLFLVASPAKSGSFRGNEAISNATAHEQDWHVKPDEQDCQGLGDWTDRERAKSAVVFWKWSNTMKDDIVTCPC
jgi:hypothetical protein